VRCDALKISHSAIENIGMPDDLKSLIANVKQGKGLGRCSRASAYTIRSHLNFDLFQHALIEEELVHIQLNRVRL
jgi:hypothetical protein